MTTVLPACPFSSTCVTPGTSRHTHPEGEGNLLVCINVFFFAHRHFFLFRPRVFSRALGSRARREPARTPRRKCGPWPRSVLAFPLPFVVLRLPLPFFVLYFRLVVFPFVSCIAFFVFLVASLLSLVADSVILLFRLGATPPRATCEPEVCVFPLRAVFLHSCGLLILVFFSSFPFFDFDLDTVCFILSFSCGYYAASSVSVSAATCLACDMYLDMYVR